jgi:hypothetical protein
MLPLQLIKRTSNFDSTKPQRKFLRPLKRSAVFVLQNRKRKWTFSGGDILFYFYPRQLNGNAATSATPTPSHPTTEQAFPGNTKENEREPKSCLSRGFNFKLGCFVIKCNCMAYTITVTSRVENSAQVLSC